MQIPTLNTPKILTLLALFVMPLAFSQPPNGPDKQEKIEQLKIAFITKELALTSEEAEKFWPVYNEMSDKLRAENKKQRELSRDIKTNYESYSEADFKKKSTAIMESQITEAQLKSSYHQKIGELIGYKKATNLLSLEQRFKRELLNRVNNDGQRPPQRKPGGPNPSMEE